MLVSRPVRKNALVSGSIFHGIGFTWLYFADSFAGLAIFEMTVGLGSSLLSGADLSLLYDSQVGLKLSPEKKARGIANLRFVKSVAEGVSALIGGVLIVHSFEITVLANAILPGVRWHCRYCSLKLRLPGWRRAGLSGT